MEQMGGRKFILILISYIILIGIFITAMNLKLLDYKLIRDFLIALWLIVCTGVGANIIEKVLVPLIPLMPDIIKNSMFGKKEVKP